MESSGKFERIFLKMLEEEMTAGKGKERAERQYEYGYNTIERDLTGNNFHHELRKRFGDVLDPDHFRRKK